MFQKSSLLLLAAIFSTSLWAAEAPSDKIDSSFMSDKGAIGDSEEPYICETSETAAGVLKLANNISSSDLVRRAGISAKAAKQIALFRAGEDAEEGTDDDEKFGSLEALDAVPFVGNQVFSALLKAHRRGLFGNPASMDAFCEDSCQGERLTATEALKRIPLPGSKVDIGTFQIRSRERMRFKSGTVLPWSTASIPYFKYSSGRYMTRSPNGYDLRTTTYLGTDGTFFQSSGEVRLELKENEIFLILETASSDLSGEKLAGKDYTANLKFRYNLTHPKTTYWEVNASRSGNNPPWLIDQQFGLFTKDEKYLNKMEPKKIFIGKDCLRIEYEYSENCVDSEKNDFTVDRQVVFFADLSKP